MRSSFMRCLCRANLAFQSPLLLARQYAVSATSVEEEVEMLREGLGATYGLTMALAKRGIIVKDKAFLNLNKYELQKNGATAVEKLSGIPLYVRQSIVGTQKISKVQFGKILKQVTSHISSVSKIFVHDGAVGSSLKCNAKVRVISDNSSAILSLSNILWETPSRAISHDSCPLTIYIASSISSSGRNIPGLGSKVPNEFAAADAARFSLVLCGKAFADANIIKDALCALTAPIMCARDGLPFSARLLVSGDSLILLFAPELTIQSCSEIHMVLASMDAGVILACDGAAPFFQTKGSAALLAPKKPTSIVFVTADSTGVIPSLSQLSPGQAAYHFLAGYQDGKFVPAYIKGPSVVDPLELAVALFLQLKENEIPSFLINVNHGGKHIAGVELLKLVESTLSNRFPEIKHNTADSKVRDLKGKYKHFLSGKFPNLPEDFYF